MWHYAERPCKGPLILFRLKSHVDPYASRGLESGPQCHHWPHFDPTHNSIL